MLSYAMLCCAVQYDQNDIYKLYIYIYTCGKIYDGICMICSSCCSTVIVVVVASCYDAYTGPTKAKGEGSKAKRRKTKQRGGRKQSTYNFSYY